MPETTATIAQPEVEKSGLDLLSQDRRFLEDTQSVVTPIEPVTPKEVEKPIEDVLTPIIEPTAEEKATKQAELTALGLKEGATEAEITAAKDAKSKEAPTEDTWTLPEVEKIVEENEGDGWKTLAATFAEKTGIELPADIADTEEAYINFQLNAIEKIKEEAQKFTIDQELAKLSPEQRLILDLNKSGVSLEEYNKPFAEVQQLKALSPEALVRRSYELQPNWTADMVDHQMQKIVADGTLDTEYKICMVKIETYEKGIVGERQAQLQQYTAHQQQVQAQVRQQNDARVKIALDKVPTFMGRKIDNTVKEFVYKELTSGKYDNMPGTPEEKVDYAYYKTLGKKGLEYMEARVLEKLTLEKAKAQHNVAPVIVGGAGKAQQTQGASEATDGLKALEEDPRFK